MKKNVILKPLNALLLLSVVFFITIFTSCESIDVAAPVITEVRNYEAAPNDTLVTSINPGQWIVLHGHNLKGAVKVTINGSPIDIKPSLFSDNTAVIQVPSSIPYNNVDPDDLNTIGYETAEGSTTFRFDVNAPPATISGNSLLASNVVGDSVFVYGTNLYLIESLTIAGVEITPIKTVSNGSSIGFVFPEINAPQPWEAVIVAASGTYTFTISVEPVILAVSNVNPSKGDLVKVFGKNLNGVTSVQFGDDSITNFTEDPDGFYVEFLVTKEWWEYSSGPVTIVSTYGTVSTPYKVNAQNSGNVGLLANMEWGDYFGWLWWGDVSLAVNSAASSGGWIPVKPDFDGTGGTNNSMFVSFDTGVLAAGAAKFCPMGSRNWIAAENITDPVENWGLQFDISVARPWNGGTLYFRTEFAEDSFVARYEPWKISAVKTVDVETDGWQTVTIPFTAFKQKSGTILGIGDSLTSFTNLLGTSGSSAFTVNIKNFSDAPTKTGFYGAIDNVRVVKLK